MICRLILSPSVFGLTFSPSLGILRIDAVLMAGALPPNDWLSLVKAPTVFISALAIFGSVNVPPSGVGDLTVAQKSCIFFLKSTSCMALCGLAADTPARMV